MVVHLAVHWVDSMVGDSVALWVLNWADTMAAPMVVDLDVRTVASLAARSADEKAALMAESKAVYLVAQKVAWLAVPMVAKKCKRMVCE